MSRKNININIAEENTVVAKIGDTLRLPHKSNPWTLAVTPHHTNAIATIMILINHFANLAATSARKCYKEMVVSLQSWSKNIQGNHCSLAETKHS